MRGRHRSDTIRRINRDGTVAEFRIGKFEEGGKIPGPNQPGAAPKYPKRMPNSRKPKTGPGNHEIIKGFFGGEDVFIIGGGQSLRGFNFQRLAGRNTIVVNHAIRDWMGDWLCGVDGHAAFMSNFLAERSDCGLGGDGIYRQPYRLLSGPHGGLQAVDNVTICEGADEPSTDAARGLYTNFASPVFALNAALLMTTGNVYLLGIDLLESKSEHYFSDQELHRADGRSPRYIAQVSKFDKFNNHELGRNRIYNLSPAGNAPFPRKNIGDVLPELPRTAALVMGRKGSTRLKFKNSLQLGTRCLTTIALNQAGRIFGPAHPDPDFATGNTFFSTDWPELAEQCRNEGARFNLITRPEGDGYTIEVLRHAVKRIPDEYEYIALLYPTHPFRNIKEIGKSLPGFYQSGCSCAGTFADFKSFVWKPSRYGNLKLANFKKRISSQEMPEQFLETGEFYIINRTIINNPDSIDFLAPDLYRLPGLGIIDIHHSCDIENARRLWSDDRWLY